MKKQLKDKQQFFSSKYRSFYILSLYLSLILSWQRTIQIFWATFVTSHYSQWENIARIIEHYSIYLCFSSDSFRHTIFWNSHVSDLAPNYCSLRQLTNYSTEYDTFFNAYIESLNITTLWLGLLYKCYSETHGHLFLFEINVSQLFSIDTIIQ